MPTTKIDVAHFLDHGPLASTTALAPRTGLSHTGADTPPRPTPEETDAAVMERIRSVVFSSGNAGTRLAGLVKRARTPAQAAAAFINARHGALGGPRGVLGKATTAVKPCPDKIGYFRNYEGGSIYYSPQTGAHEIRGAIRTKWIQLGAERGFLGYPTTGERTGADRDARGRYNHFQHGSIYWHPSTGAHEVHGAIHAKYVELGAEASFLGYPTTDERQTPDRRGRFNHFQAGSIYWTPQTGAHEIHGLIRKLWAEKGWERNPDLGYPISDERIPHRSVGHVPPPRRRKPLRELPADVVRVPDEQPSPTLELIAAPALATALAASPSAAEEPAPSRSRGSNPDLRHLGGLSLRRIPSGTALRPGIVVKPPKIINPSRNHKGESRDRFSDFENGVLFWIRGASAATELSPRAKAPNGDRLAWNAGEIVQIATTQIRRHIGTIPGANLTTTAFIGTTAYSWDGAGVHNRNHRIRATLKGFRLNGIVPTPAEAIVEVRAEVSFDPVDREIVLYLTSWRLASAPAQFIGGGDLARTLHRRLDPALWQQSLVARIPATEEDPIAVLSVKTRANGDVVVYLEP